MTRAPYLAVAAAGVLSAIHAALLWCGGVPAKGIAISAALLWTVVVTVCLTSLHFTHRTHKHGNRPGPQRH